jgi:hypothetical protein
VAAAYAQVAKPFKGHIDDALGERQVHPGLALSMYNGYT